MKHIVIIGASGFIGSVLLKEALSRGHQVKAIVRNPEKIAFQHNALQVVKGDVTDENRTAGFVCGADIVISAYNPGWMNPNIHDDTLKGYSAIINGVKKAGVKRLLIVGGAGSLLVAPGIKLMDTGAIPENFLPAVKALAKVYTDLLQAEKEIDWVFFSPAGTIAPGERTETYRLGKDNLIVNEKGESHISVEDYAVAMINEAEAPQHHMERFTIGY